MQECAEQIQTEERYRFLAENIQDVLFIQDMDLRITFVSPGVTSLFGISVEEALNDDLTNYMTPASYEKAKKDFQKYAALALDGRDVHIPLMEYEYIRKDGSTFWGELKLAFLYDESGNLAGAQGVLRDIDERKRMQEALQESESLFRTIFDLSPQAIALTEVETGKLREVNQTFCELTQFTRDEIIGKTTTDLRLYPERDRERFVKKIRASGRVHGMEMDFRAKDGSILNALMFSKAIPLTREKLLLTIFLDMTERKTLEAMLRHAQKMEAVGTLAGGIAHDFNNLLQAILGYSQVLLLDKDPQDDEYEKIEAIEKMARRGGDLTRRLLIYARKMQSKPKPLNLNNNIIQTCKVLERTLPRMITIELHLSEDLGVVNCDPVEFEQIAMNLSINARDAMPEGGKLRIETKNVFLDEKFCRSHLGATRGAYVLVTFSDSGSGIENTLMGHIFEPFFTTKDTGKGTGLGLAIVYGIVKAHKGYITCSSTPGNGATFEIYFPALDGMPPDEKESPQVKTVAPRGTQNILVVDDEDLVRNSTKEMLEHFGYSVFLAEDGKQALDVYTNKGDGIDLVILDLGMPGMGGQQCLKELLRLNPDIKVIIASGYSPDTLEDDFLVRGAKEFVGKPYQAKSLLGAVRRVLEK